MSHSRRSVLAALGAALPFVLPGRSASAAAPGAPPVLRFRSFEEAVREAFAGPGPTTAEGRPLRRVEVGHSDLLSAGVQGCHNDRPFAGFAAGHLRIVRVGCEPGPVRDGVRLYVGTVDVAVTDGRPGDGPGRPLDFAALPPAPAFADPAPGAGGPPLVTQPKQPLPRGTGREAGVP